jgi:hypothetical protein
VTGGSLHTARVAVLPAPRQPGQGSISRATSSQPETPAACAPGWVKTYWRLEPLFILYTADATPLN